MKKLLLALAFVVLLGGLSLGLSASTAMANVMHYCTLIDPYGHPVLQKVWVRNGDPTIAYFHSIGAGQSTIRAYGFPICSGLCLPCIRHFELTLVVQ